MCMGKTPKIVMPQQPLMPNLPPLPQLEAPPPPKKLYIPAPKAASSPDYGTGTGSSGYASSSSKKGKKANVSSTKVNLKIDPSKGGINL